MRSIFMMDILRFLNTPAFLFFTIFISIFLKILLLIIIVPQTFRAPKNKKNTCLFLIIVLLCSIIGELTWEIKLFRLIFLPLIPYSFILFCVRISWGFLIPQYQCLGLFLDSLTEQNYRVRFFQKIILFFSSIIGLYFFYLAFFAAYGIKENERLYAVYASTLMNSPLEIIMMRVTVYYILPLLILPNLFFCIKKLKTKKLPKILHHQLTIIIKYLMLPFFLAELCIALPCRFTFLKDYYNATVGVSALLITYIVYYCIHRIMRLRFLNFSNHVELPHTYNFVDDFKVILEQLSFASSIYELNHITSTFFKQAFSIPTRNVVLYLRQPLIKEEIKINEYEFQIEQFLVHQPSNLIPFVLENKILILDELEFSNFIEEDPTISEIIIFLKHINGEIFLPILEKDRIIGAIIIAANSRATQLYSNIERDEMLVFARYLSNIINLLQHRNLDALIMQEKELKEELYKKHQEVQQYKESIRSFLKNSKQKEIGILFYKHRRFIYANQTAKEMIKVNINTQEGHPITRALKQVARQVEQYKAPQTTIVKDNYATRYIISGVLNLEQNNVILTISYPDVADIITQQLALLKDPSKWDYLLYLETTKPGQLINQLIPGNGETLLNFKISLLQTALSKKATLLEMPSEDLIAMVELLHHISMRENLQVIKLTTTTSALEIGTKLFGINSLFNAKGPKPLLEKLDGNGTLFIQNIEFLDPETQEYLAEFIKYGYFRVFKSEYKIASSVRIICSSQKSLLGLAQENKFSLALFNELKQCSITFPSLQELPDTELTDLAQGYTQQALQTNDFKTLLELTENECVRLIKNKPLSLQELKTKVQYLLTQKTKKHNIEKEIQFNPAYEITDPELIQASLLGRHALRDHKIMVTLWNKFKNQNIIAAFLGVNRSSVNRRVKKIL